MYVYICIYMPDLPSKPERIPRKMITRVYKTWANEGRKNRKW